MCSKGGDNLYGEDESALIAMKEDSLMKRYCNKCRGNDISIVLRSKDAYCQECFLKGTVHKFKALLGKHKLIRPNDKVLVIYNGSESSTAMLHFIRSGLDLSTPKRLKFDPYVIFVEPENDLSLEVRQEWFEQLTKAASLQKFPLYFASLTDYVCNSDVTIFKGHSDYLERPESGCNKTVKGPISLTNRKLINDHFSRELLIKLAMILECKYCFTPDLSLDVAANLFSNISFGRGGYLPLDVGMYDDRDLNVKIVRPMRQLDMQEVQFYNKLNNLLPVDIGQVNSKTNNIYDSIQSLVHKFVENLQSNYPATISTIVKTGDKLGIAAATNQKCKLCKCPIENKVQSLSSNESTEFSHFVSTTQITDQSQFNQCELPDSCSLSNEEYCFSCNKITKFID